MASYCRFVSFVSCFSSSFLSLLFPSFSLPPFLHVFPTFSASSFPYFHPTKGEKDWEKYEVARKLKTCVDNIRNQYTLDLKSRKMETRQRAVALYFIDKVCLFRAAGQRRKTLEYRVLHVYAPVLREITFCQSERFFLMLRSDTKSHVNILEINAMCLLDCLFCFRT